MKYLLWLGIGFVIGITFPKWKPWLDRGLLALKDRFTRTKGQ